MPKKKERRETPKSGETVTEKTSSLASDAESKEGNKK